MGNLITLFTDADYVDYMCDLWLGIVSNLICIGGGLIGCWYAFNNSHTDIVISAAICGLAFGGYLLVIVGGLLNSVVLSRYWDRKFGN